MYENILSANQKKMLPFLETFHREYYLVGGTAIALQLGHRESIDFDMFKPGTVHKKKIITKLQAFGWDYHLLYTDMDSFHITVLPFCRIALWYFFIVFLLSERNEKVSILAVKNA